MGAQVSRSKQAEAALLAFCNDLDERIQAVAFANEGVARFWDKIAPKAKHELSLLREQYAPQLDIRSDDDRSKFEDALWRSMSALQAAQSDEFQYADWLLRASEVLRERLNERSLLVGHSVPEAGVSRFQGDLEMQDVNRDWVADLRQVDWPESNSGPPDLWPDEGDDENPGESRGLHLVHAHDHV